MRRTIKALGMALAMSLTVTGVTTAQVRVDGRTLPEPGQDNRPDRPEFMDIPLDLLPNYRDRMRRVVAVLGEYAAGSPRPFFTVLRNGAGLLVKQEREAALEKARSLDAFQTPGLVPQGALMRRTVQALDGNLVNGLYCSPRQVSQGFIERLRRDAGLPVLSVERCSSEGALETAWRQGREEGVVVLTDAEGGVFSTVPDLRPPGENSAHIRSLGQAVNGLMMADGRAYATTEDWVMALEDTNWDILILDAFRAASQPLSFNQVQRLKYKQLGSRRLVLARLDLTTASDERYYWQRDWSVGDPYWIDWPVDGAPGSYRVLYWDPAWKEILGQYFQGLMELRYDGVLLEGAGGYRYYEALSPLEAYGIRADEE